MSFVSVSKKNRASTKGRIKTTEIVNKLIANANALLTLLLNSFQSRDWKIILMCELFHSYIANAFNILFPENNRYLNAVNICFPKALWFPSRKVMVCIVSLWKPDRFSGQKQALQCMFITFVIHKIWNKCKRVDEMFEWTISFVCVRTMLLFHKMVSLLLSLFSNRAYLALKQLYVAG